jgi:hypothetical protein
MDSPRKSTGGSMVADILPWPKGHGFSGADEWWSHVNQKHEKKRLDQLLGSALLNQSIQEKLIEQRDEDLLNAFGLSEDTKRIIRSIEASSISEFARAIISNSAMTPLLENV